MSDYDISGMTDEEKDMPKYTYGSRIPYEWVDDVITTLHKYQKAFEDIREELLYTMDMCEPGNPKQDNFVGGLQIAAEILNKHDPSKKGKETHDA